MQQKNNPYILDLVKTLDERYSITNKNLSVSEWVSKNTTLKGQAFNTDRYPFQKEILDDMSKTLVVKKISQIGLTEIQIRKMLAFLYRNPNTQGLFSFPDKPLRDSFSQTRLRPLLNDNAIFNQFDRKTVRSVSLAQVGNSFLNVVVGNESAATSLSIDIMAVDEVDLTDQEVLGLYDSRLQNSDIAIRHDFSTPTFADYGIDAAFQFTDQREYMCKCSACNHWQIPDWDHKWVKIPGLSNDFDLSELTEHLIDGIDITQAKIVCEKCGTPLDLASKDREWVPQMPSRSVHGKGYQVRPFSTSRLGVQYIVTSLLRYRKRDFIRGFYNTVLGKTYQDDKSRLQESDIVAAFSNPEPKKVDKTTPIFVGIDVGLTCHVVIGTSSGIDRCEIIEILTVPSAQLVEWCSNLCENYNVVRGCIDRYPYTPTSHEILQLSEYKIFPMGYNYSPNNLTDKRREDHPEDGYFECNRTWSLDTVAKLIRLRRLPINGYKDNKDDYKEHLQNMVRAEEPEKQADWKKLSKEDHFFHATNYFILAVRLQEYIQGASVKGADHRTCYGILTPDMLLPSTGIVGGGAQSPQNFSILD